MKIISTNVFLLLMICTGNLFSQVDSIKYTSDFKFREGIYRSFEEFKRNEPSIEEKAIVNENSEIQFLVGNFTKAEKIYYYDSKGNYQRLKRNELWGFCSKGNIYVNLKNNYQRLIKIGSIIHFTESHGTLYYNRRAPISKINRPNRDIQYMIDFQTGVFLSYNLKNFLSLLIRDKDLYFEFTSIKRNSKKEKQMFIYLNRFNDRNPVYFKTY